MTVVTSLRHIDPFPDQIDIAVIEDGPLETTSVLTPICNRGRPDPSPYRNLIVKSSPKGLCGHEHAR
jgi:hypothetical protein